MEIPMAENLPAVYFNCPCCGVTNSGDYSLEPDIIDGSSCNTDIITCQSCGNQVKVVEWD